MKRKIIDLIGKCISNKDYMLTPTKTNGLYYNSSVSCHKSEKLTRRQYKNRYPNLDDLITETVNFHDITFRFVDEPSIKIYAQMSEDLVGKRIIYVTKKILGFEYQKKYVVDVITRNHQYILLYGELKFELQDFEVNDIVKDYQQNLSDFREVKYTEQIKERTEKYS